jgi:hypothetical protein
VSAFDDSVVVFLQLSAFDTFDDIIAAFLQL